MSVQKTATNLEDATKIAIDMSREGSKESHIILSNGTYYVEDESSMIRVWEEHVASYSNGEIQKK